MYRAGPCCVRAWPRANNASANNASAKRAPTHGTNTTTHQHTHVAQTPQPPNQPKPTQTNPNQIKPNQTKPNQTQNANHQNQSTNNTAAASRAARSTASSGRAWTTPRRRGRTPARSRATRRGGCARPTRRGAARRAPCAARGTRRCSLSSLRAGALAHAAALRGPSNTPGHANPKPKRPHPPKKQTTGRARPLPALLQAAQAPAAALQAPDARRPRRQAPARLPQRPRAAALPGGVAPLDGRQLARGDPQRRPVGAAQLPARRRGAWLVGVGEGRCAWGVGGLGWGSGGGGLKGERRGSENGRGGRPIDTARPLAEQARTLKKTHPKR